MSEQPAATAPPPGGGFGADGDLDLEAGLEAALEAGRDHENPPAPEPLGVEPTVTGNAEVDAVLERLADADALPTESHVEVYEDVHRGLRDALTALDARPGPPGPVPAEPGTIYDRR